MGNPKGFAYIEFLEADAVPNAILLDNSELRNRQIKVGAVRRALCAVSDVGDALMCRTGAGVCKVFQTV